MNTFNCIGGNKGFTLDELKELALGKDKDKKKLDLIMKFYFEFLLKTEIKLLDTSNIKEEFFEYDFYLGNDRKIDFEQDCFIRSHSNTIKRLDRNEIFYYKQVDLSDNIYYTNIGKEKYVELDINNFKEKVEIDKLYYNKKVKEAENICVRSKDDLSKRGKDNKKSDEDFFESLKDNKSPIGIKYRYQAWEDDSLILYKDKNGDIRCIRDLTKKEKEDFKWRQNKGSLLLYDEDNKKIKKINNFIELKLINKHFFYQGKKDYGTHLYHLKDNEPKDINISNLTKNQVYFSNRKEIYDFKNTLIYEHINTHSLEYKAIVLKSKEGKGKKTNYIFSNSHIDIFQSSDFNKREYDMKLTNHSKRQFIVWKKYEILYKEQINEKSFDDYKIEDISIKHNMSINDITIYTFLNQKIEELSLNLNNILMKDTDKFSNLYLKILYRFRNSIAHGEFKILSNEIIFCNTKGNEVLFRARIEKSKIHDFMKELEENL